MISLDMGMEGLLRGTTTEGMTNLHLIMEGMEVTMTILLGMPIILLIRREWDEDGIIEIQEGSSKRNSISPVHPNEGTKLKRNYEQLPWRRY